jgi:DNA-binding NarL/FixJ family response regulator
MEDNEKRAGARVLALVADLIFAARVRGAAPAGMEVRTTSRAQQLKEEAGASAPALILVDLGAADDPVELIRWVRERESLAGVEVVAFGSHVDVERLNAARAAGANTVLARSAFVGRLPELLARGAGK